ncbi:MAG: bifunctional adenosylcobinamide kinase/adenosylcobinamide-phosphate guanylyltransferase [Fastidiosipilaceae bacterium]
MRILLTGGSAHGKSTYAETLANRFALPRYFIDTTGPSAEVGRRSERMLRLRADGRFTVLERGADLQQIRLPLRGVVLLDCMCHLTANEMFDQTGEIRDAHDIILMGIESLAARSEVLIVVTNDVGADGGQYDYKTRSYILALGRLNNTLAERFDSVYEMVCGIPIVLKGEPLG